MRTQDFLEEKSSGTLHKMLPKLFFFFVVVLTAYNIFWGQLNIFRTLELKKSLMEIESKKAQLNKENSKLEKLLNSINKNPDYYKEIFIREYMQLQKDNEKIILYYD